MSLWLLDQMRSYDKLETKYFFLQKSYGYQPLQGTDVWWGKARYEVAQL